MNTTPLFNTVGFVPEVAFGGGIIAVMKGGGSGEEDEEEAAAAPVLFGGMAVSVVEGETTIVVEGEAAMICAVPEMSIASLVSPPAFIVAAETYGGK